MRESPSGLFSAVPRTARFFLSRLVFGLMYAMLLTVLGCGPSGPERLKVKFIVDQKINDNNPVSVDIVVLYDMEMKDELARLTAMEWFQQRDARVRSDPTGQKFQLWRWELTPGLELRDVDEPLRGLPAQGYVFADYSSKGRHSAMFDPNYGQTIALRRTAYNLIVGNEINPQSHGWRPWVGWSSVGVGIAGLVVGTIFAIQLANTSDEMSKMRQADNKPDQDDEQGEYDKKSDEYDNEKLGTILGFSIGGAFLLAGILILVWPDTNESSFRDLSTTDGGYNGSMYP